MAHSGSISKEQLENEIIPEIDQWSLSNGLVMYPPAFDGSCAAVAPVTVMPSALSKKSFEEAVGVQTAFNELYAKIVIKSDEWLRQQIDEVARYDKDFTGKLWELRQKAESIGVTQKIRLGLFRSDYLVDSTSDQIKQVEFNTVSVSFGGLSPKVSRLHKHLYDHGLYNGTSHCTDFKNIQISDSDKKLANGLAEAVKRYDNKSENKPIVLFVVQPNERNVFDQKVLELNLSTDHGILSKRMTLQDVEKKTFMNPETRRLYIDQTQKTEIGVVYFRSAYDPNEFKTDIDWENRLYLETSHAIKAPDLMTQLAGTKKVQQLLTNAKTISQFLSDSQSVDQLLKTFVKIYPLDNSELGAVGKKLAFEAPEQFVLKPQREGGGNNIYKEDIPKLLESLPKEEWKAYILMELIKPEANKDNIVARGKEHFAEPIVSELGIFGCVLFDDNEILCNNESGYLLRSKFNSSNEGGVAAGFGCIDSVYLV